MLEADGAEKVEPFAVGQAEVEEQYVGFGIGDHLQALAPGKCRGGSVPAPLQNGGKRRLNITLVVDDADEGL